jgi:hypothetical protein
MTDNQEERKRTPDEEMVCPFCDAVYHGNCLWNESPWGRTKTKIECETRMTAKPKAVFIEAELGQCMCGAWYIGE